MLMSQVELLPLRYGCRASHIIKSAHAYEIVQLK